MALRSQFMRRLLFYRYPFRFLISTRIRRALLGYSRPSYYYCLVEAAKLAKSLSISRVSAIEFGVAGGNGLVEIEKISTKIKKKYDVEIEIYGFDTGKGLPPADDYRDLPYRWQEGFFSMNQDALEKRLTVAKLVLGDVRETVGTFFSQYDPAPIGAILFDLDYYSSTRNAFEVFDSGEARHYLPRIQCFFDDLATIDSVGVRLAIQEFNGLNQQKKIENSMEMTFASDPTLPGWQIFEFHDFDHPTYCTPIKEDDQLPLR